MNIELTVIYNNGDNGHCTEEMSVAFEIESTDLAELILACKENPSDDTFNDLLRKIYDNPDMSEGQGIAYDKLLPIFNRMAYDKLGWADVTIDVVAIKLDGDALEYDPEELEIRMWSLQLVREEGSMYCYY